VPPFLCKNSHPAQIVNRAWRPPASAEAGSAARSPAVRTPPQLLPAGPRHINTCTGRRGALRRRPGNLGTKGRDRQGRAGMAPAARAGAQKVGQP
jgi:hypothetical protein